MSLDPAKLENVRTVNGKTVARCPACAESGKDKSGEHLFINGAGKFGCIAFPGAEGDQHRKRIFELVGVKAISIAKETKQQSRRIAAVYPYHDEAGNLLFEKVRYTPKDFSQRRPDPAKSGAFIYNLNGTRRVLYCLPELLGGIATGETVFLPEGEEDCDRLRRAGLVASSCVEGAAGPWRDDYTATLTGAAVVLLIDEDKAGHGRALEVSTALHGQVKRLRLVRLPGITYREKHGDDVSDWFKAGHSVEELLALVDAAADCDPQRLAGELEGLAGLPSNETAIAEPEKWEKPIGFDAPANLPPFPIEVLPEPFKSFVEDVAASKQVPPDLPGCLTLGAVALATAKRFRVYVGQSHDEPLNLFLMALMDPGSRKSDTFRACLAPVEDYEIERAESAGPEIARAKERLAIEESRLAELRKRAGKEDDPTARRAITIEAETLAASLTIIPPPPRLLCGDISPEHLATLLCANGGRMAVADAEGALVFEIMGGKYSKGGNPNCEIFLKGHAGDAVRVDRTGRAPDFARSAALTCILTAQPAIMKNLPAKDQLRGRGLFARFLFSMPCGLIGERAYTNRAMNPEFVSTYAARLRELLAVDPVDRHDPEAHRRLELNGEALTIWARFADEIESKQKPDGELSHLTDFASKLAGAAARLSGVLHLMKHGPAGPVEIEAATVAGAWALGLYFLEHTKSAFSELGTGGDLGLARRVYGWIIRNRPDRFTLGRLFDDLRRGSDIERSDDLLPAIEIHEDRNIIRREPKQPGNRPGRKSFGSWEVNPAIIRGDT